MKRSDYCTRALKIQGNISPKGHPNIAVSLSCIGRTYYFKKDYDRALECLEKFLRIRETLLSSLEDTNVVDILTYLGLMLIKQHRSCDVLIYYERALKVSKHIYILLDIGHLQIV